MRKLLLLVAFAAGYVLGARAGRQRYDQIMSMVDQVRTDPRVQQKAHQAVDLAKEQAPVVADKVTHAASAAASAAAAKVTGSDDGPGAAAHGRAPGRPAVVGGVVSRRSQSDLLNHRGTALNDLLNHRSG
ncbi:MAG: hypothetical protein QM747_13835 [Nocardioides sp.]